MQGCSACASLPTFSCLASSLRAGLEKQVDNHVATSGANFNIVIVQLNGEVQVRIGMRSGPSFLPVPCAGIFDSTRQRRILQFSSKHSSL